MLRSSMWSSSRPGVATSTSTPCAARRPAADAERRRTSTATVRPSMAAVGAEAVGDLGGQLARRREDQHARSRWRSGGGGWRRGGAGSAARRPRSCRCRSGRCRAGRVAGEHVRDRLGLDRGRHRIAFVGERLQKGATQPEFTKIDQGLHLSKMAISAKRTAQNAVRRSVRRRSKTPRVAWASGGKF